MIFTIALGILCTPFAAIAQTESKLPLIGYLEFGSAAPGTPYIEAFRQGMRDLGWIDGKNVALVVRYANGKHDLLPELAAELVSLNADVIFASSTPAALAAQSAAPTTPIVIGFVADPVGSGLVSSLAHPRGNITGWSHLTGVALNAKRLELLKEVVPRAKQVAALWNPANPVHGSSLQNVDSAAGKLEMQLHAVGAKAPGKLEEAFSTMDRLGVQALTVPPDGMFIAYQTRIIDLAAKYRIPTMYGVMGMARAGGLMAYGVNLPEQYRRGVTYVDRILKGAKPASLPVEQPTTFELILNLKTAKILGIKFPTTLLLLADEIVR